MGHLREADTRVEPTAVRITGQWMPLVRADETAQPDAYLDDPPAASLITERARTDLATLQQVQAPFGNIVIRGRLGDEALQDGIALGARQAVCLGAGSDTRAYRRGLPEGFRYYEVDLPGVLEAKHRTLDAAGFRPTCERIVVEADLREEWEPVLRASGFQPGKPTVWLAEGLLYYLLVEEADALVQKMSELSSSGSLFVFDALHPEFHHASRWSPFLGFLRELGSPLVSAIPDPVAWLGGHGWHADAHLPEDVWEGRCAWLPEAPPRLRDHTLFWYVRARRNGW